MHKESSLSPGATAHSETSNDSISGAQIDTPSPAQSPVTVATATTRMLTPTPVGHGLMTAAHQSGGATSQIALTNPRAIQQHLSLLNARLLGSGLPASTQAQISAMRTSASSEAVTSLPQHLSADSKFDMSGTSLIKAQLLAPRVGQLQVNPYGATQPQVMLTPRGAQMSQAEIRNQLFAQSLARSLSLPAGIGLRPPMTPTTVPHQVQAQQFALSLAGKTNIDHHNYKNLPDFELVVSYTFLFSQFILLMEIH